MTRADLDPVAARAARLLRWYPPRWRARYGAEFAELLIADLAERPRCPGRTADVVGNGVLARLRYAGLGGPLPDAADEVRACLAVLVCAGTLFLVLGVTAWSQLGIGWQWAPPADRATTAAVVLMSAGLVLVLVLALLAAVPACWYLGRAVARSRRPAPGWGRPASLAGLGALVLILGAHHFANGWPGTGGHPWPQQGMVPGGVAAFGWAVTLSVTSYWAHPAALLAFPAGELAWMAISPVALACLTGGLTAAVRRLELPSGVMRHLARMGCVAISAMTLFLAGGACWLAGGGAGPQGLFRAGSIDVGALAGMALALVVAGHAAYRARAAALPHRPAGIPG